MIRTITLAETPALDDLQVFLARAARVEDGAVRLIAGDGVLAVYAAVLYPVGLTDTSPTVLGLRTVAIQGDDEFDVVVPLASLLARVERAQHDIAGAISPAQHPAMISLPTEVHTVTWAGISPPRGGWHIVPGINAGMLERVARDGISEVASALPEAAGDAIVRKVRSEVWGRPIDGADHIPAGAAFAALSLGFLGGQPTGPVDAFETGPWTRLSTKRGHVLIKRRAWTLAR